jgi:hypothetical protein
VNAYLLNKAGNEREDNRREQSPWGESKLAECELSEPDLIVDTPGGAVSCRLRRGYAIERLGLAGFFAQFLQAGGGFEALCEDAPLHYRSRNAPSVRAVRAGHFHFGRIGGALALRASLGDAH